MALTAADSPSAPLRLGLLGHPVTHSLSPVLHAAAARSVGTTVDYQLFDIAPADLPAWLATAPTALAGFNVTAPHKLAVQQWVAAHGPAAARLGAVNTVTCGLRPTGWNTDLFGFSEALGSIPDGPVVVLGGGGAARAVVAALHDRGVRDLYVLTRRLAQGQALLARLGGVGQADTLKFAGARMREASLVIDAIGPAALDWLVDLPFATTRPDARIITLAYGDRITPLLNAIRAADRCAEDGLAMLGWQGIAAFEHWTGLRPDPVAVHAALRAAVDPPV